MVVFRGHEELPLQKGKKKMCMLNDVQYRCVATYVHSFVDRRKSFTGYDVVKRMRRDGYDARDYSAQNVSSCVREMFNGRDPVFAGYACIPVPGASSPLLFFPVARWVKGHCQKIQAAIDSE